MAVDLDKGNLKLKQIKRKMDGIECMQNESESKLEQIIWSVLQHKKFK